MKRKYSISLGIGAIGSAAYLALLGWYVMNLLQGTQTGIAITMEELPLNLILHSCLMVVAAGFTWTAFFTGMFPVAAAACICFTVGAIIFYHYLLFSAPLIIVTIIGSVFCYKQQVKKQEKEAEEAYHQNKVSQEKKKVLNEKSQGKRVQQQRNTRQEMLTRRMQHNQNMQARQDSTTVMTPNYAQAFQQPLYPQIQDPYAPLTQPTMMQPLVQQTPLQPVVYPYPVYTGDQSSQQPLQAVYQPLPLIQSTGFQQGVVNPVQNPFPQPNQLSVPFQTGVMSDRNQNAISPQPHAGHTRPEGYFDDYGNFHPGSEQ